MSTGLLQCVDSSYPTEDWILPGGPKDQGHQRSQGSHDIITQAPSPHHCQKNLFRMPQRLRIPRTPQDNDIKKGLIICMIWGSHSGLVKWSKRVNKKCHKFSSLLRESAPHIQINGVWQAQEYPSLCLFPCDSSQRHQKPCPSHRLIMASEPGRAAWIPEFLKSWWEVQAKVVLWKVEVQAVVLAGKQ